MAIAQERVDALAARIEALNTSLQETLERIDGVPGKIDRLQRSLAARIAPYRDLIEAGSTPVVDAVNDTLQRRAQALDGELAALNEGIEDILEQVGSQLPANLAGPVIAEVRKEAEDLREQAEGTLGRTDAHFDQVTTWASEQLTELDDRVEAMKESLQQRIQADIEGLRERIRSEYMEVVENGTELMIGRLQHGAERLIRDPIEQQAEEIANALADELQALLDRLASKLRAFLAQMKEQIAAQDEQAQARREEITEALDVLKSAIPPLESAFKAFSALAGTVGLSF